MTCRKLKQAAILVLLVFCVCCSQGLAYSPKPDLTAAGAIATLKTDANSSPLYAETYNLGATGLRGWMYRDPANMGQEGLQTNQDRQILVTAVGVGTPAATAGLAVDDVILGVKAGTGTALVYPADGFTSDARKAFGAAITEAETTAKAGVLRVLRWRAGVPTPTISEVQLTLAVMGDYTATAPYSCPKSTLILANAIAKLDQETANSMTGGWNNAASALALLAGVKPSDANYASVQTKLANYAHNKAPANLSLSGCDTWNWGYVTVFLSEYYLRTVADGAPDASVLSGINKYTTALAKGQSKYGTFGHGGAEPHADGSLHGSISWYGPVNSAGLIANLGIVLGKKALVAGGIAIDPEIDPAIDRGAKFFAYYVNKGSIPYGEHEPWSGGHASNGKDPMAAVMFAMMGNKPAETEYFSRMSVAGWVGREYGHTGQGFSYLWSALGAAMGGDAAVTAHINQVRWHYDLERRTDGSFVYDGGEQYGGSSTNGYFGASSYYGLSPNACFVLAYSLPLKRLFITGRNANPVNTLDAARIANEIAAATYERDCVNFPVGSLTTPGSLMAAFSEYSPVVRHDAAVEMAKRTLSTAELNNQIALITNGTMSPDPNVRQAVCETLGIRLATGALTALGQRLSDTDLWVRGKAANALKNFGSGASPQLTPMLTAFTANATDPNVIVWDDPIQIANGYLADSLFQAMASSTNSLTGSSRTSLLYPALRAGLKQPDGMARMYLGNFLKNRLTLTDVQAIAPSIVNAAAERSPADRMFSDVIRYDALSTLGKFKIEEGIPLCLEVKEQTWHGDDWLPFDLLTSTYKGSARDALPTLYKWQQHLPQFAADPSVNVGTRLADITSKIASTIAAIENDTAPPALTYFKSATLTANPAGIALPVTSTTLTATITDLDAGKSKFVWSKVSGAGNVTFTPVTVGDNTTDCTAAFATPGTYTLRVTAVDRSILDYNRWITYTLGYFDFQTYNEMLGAVTKNVTVVVGPDPNRAPVPTNQSLSTAQDVSLPLTLAATDPNGDTLTYAVVANPTNGSLLGTAPGLTYVPNTGFTGADSFTFKAHDGKVESSVGTVTIDVGTVTNHRPVAANQYVTTPEETSKAITLSGTDSDGNPLTYDIVSQPSNGTLTGTAPNLTYVPANNYPASNLNGPDSFMFTVRDASLTSAVATVSIVVTPVNDAPVATAQTFNANVNVANPLTLAGTDAEGYSLLYTVATNPTHGTLTGTAPNLSYRPTTNYHGPDSFTFRATDSEGLNSTVATVNITVTNDPPVANAQTLEIQPNIGRAITLTGSDNCNDPLTFAIVTPPTNGTITGTAPNITYTPNANYSGPDSFTFRANDGVNNSAPATVALNVVGWLTWTNVAPGAWSAGASWQGGIAPSAGGSTNGWLLFNTAGYSVTSNNDLAGTFNVSRLNFGSSLPAMTVSGNALALTVNSSSQPQIIHDSAGAITVSNAITISTGTTISGSGAGDLTLSGIISGGGSLTKTKGGNLTLSGVSTFTGGVTNTTGTFTIGNKNGCGTGPITLAAGTTFQQANFEGNSSSGALPNALVLTGSGNVVFNIPFGGAKDIWLTTTVSGSAGIRLQGGTRSLTLDSATANSFSGGIILGDYNNRVVIGRVTSLGTGTFRSERLTDADGQLETMANLSAGVANAFDIATGSWLNISANGTNHLLLSGPISSAGGTGSLSKSGTATLTLTGSNTYTGTTKVKAGILSCSSPLSLGGGPLEIATGATVQLNYTGTRRVASLTLGGVAQAAAGTYGAAGSGATNTSAFFTGTGTVTVGPAFAVTTTSLALTTGNPQSFVGGSLTFTATVANGNAPTGSVTFYDGNTLIGTSPLNASFQATLPTSSLAVGSHTITARYAGNAANDPSVSSALAIQISNPADIQSFSIPGMTAVTIGTNTISVTVPFATVVAALSPSYTLSAGATCNKDNGGPTTYDFTSPVVYTVQSGDTLTTKNYTVTVVKSPASTAKDITSFVFPGLAAPTIGTNTIALSVPFGTPVSAMTPYYTVSPLAVQDVNFPSGTTRNFTSAQTYTIKDQAGASKVYTVTVSVSTPSTACDILACNFTGLGAATVSGTTVTLTVPPSQAVTSLTPNFTISPLATISPATGVAQNFTSPIVYRVTAQNGTTFKDYTVSVLSYNNWPFSASLFVLTTPEGANLPAGATETNFPLLVRLNASSFNFTQAQSDGRDIRFSTVGGTILPYQIEQWDAAAGTASIWVKIPTITGNARQEIKMYWGQTGVLSESNGPAVFNATNGYACVMHMNESLTDEIASVVPTNVGTTVATGMIGKGRNFTVGNGIACGTAISNFPQGTTAHSTQAWFRASSVNSEVVDWGVEGGGFNKVQIRVISPPKLYVDGNFASVTGNTSLNPALWHHVTHTYSGGVAKLYLNGVLDASASVSMNLPNPSRMWIGGWYDGYSHVGDIDEVRISKVARSANWIKLEYENQKPLQTLVGSPVQSGSTFAVNPTSVTINEGASATLNGQAGGAQKVYWIERKNGIDTVIATDVFSLAVNPGRVNGSQSYAIQFKGIYASTVQTVDVPINITEYLPDPIFTLGGPSAWDGRQTIQVTSTVTNLTDLQAKGVANLNYKWTATGVAVIKQTSAGTMTLTRSQGSGPLTVTLTIDNGGTPVTVTKGITVTEPATDAWVQRTPGATEKVVNNQFIARDDTGFGKVYYNGTQTGSPTSVFLKIYTTDTGSDVQYGSTLRQNLVGTSYAFTAPIASGKFTYKIVYGTTNASSVDTVVATVTNVICGDAYIIEGQSNALATDNSAPNDPTTDPWIRTYGKAGGGWGSAISKGSEMELGLWGMILAKRLSLNANMPICIINGAVGGTRIDQHQANPADHSQPGSLYSIYANLYNRVVGAKLTHGIRGLLWHQGEQDQGSGGPDGDYDYKFYQQYFVDMSAAWKQDFPNLQRYYLFQIWPAACGDVSRNDQLREVQRTLPYLYSNMKIMSTLGINPGSSCHYELAGYQKFSDLIGPLVEQDVYGLSQTTEFGAADLKKAYYSTLAHNEITLEFSQNMTWSNVSNSLFFLDGLSGKVTAGTVTGKLIKLTLNAASTAQKITYLQGTSWNGVQSNLLYGANGIAALTFADVPIGEAGLTSTTALVRHAGTGSTSVYGDALVFDVTVSGSGAAPTGTVTLKDGGAAGTTIGTGTLTGGTVSITTRSLTVGTHANIVAVYSGDASYTPSTSSPLSTQTVNKATPVVTVTGTTSFSYTGTLQGPDTASTGGSTGALTFSYAGVSGTIFGPGSTKPSGVGNYTVTASVAADANYNAASSPATAFIIAKATPTVTVTGATSFTYNGSPQGPTTATTGGSTGALSFSYAGVSGTVYGPASSLPTDAGNYNATANVAADANYNSASSSATAFTIAKATPTLSVTNSPVNFTGSPQAAAVASSVPGVVSAIKYDGSATVPSAAATYAITADFAPSDSANFNSLTAASAGNFTINPPPGTIVGTATAAASGQTGITVTMPYTGDVNTNNTYSVEYKLSAASTWTTWVTNAAHVASPYSTVITGLIAATSYDVRVTYNDADGVTGTNPQTVTVTTGNTAITELSAWSNLYHGTATTQQDITYSVPAGSGTQRILLIAIASSQSAVGARTVTLTYGGQTLTFVRGDMATATIRQHTALYHLNEAGLDAATNSTLSVTVSGGTTRVTDVFAAVYDGVDQANPIADSKTNNNGTTASNPLALSPGLAVNSRNQAVEIISSLRSGNATPRTVSTYATNWSLATQQTWTTTDGVRNMITKRTIPSSNVAADTASTSMSNNSLASMAALSLAPAKVMPVLLVSGGPATYNAAAQSATVVGSTAGTVTNVKYNGSATLPTNAGSYVITADFAPTDSQTFNSLTAAAAGNFVIQKATPTVAVANSPATYSGAAQAAAVNGSVAGTASNLKYDGASTVPVSAGTYSITADFAPSDSANFNSLTAVAVGDFLIQKAEPTISIVNSPVTYNGSAQAAMVNGSVAGAVSNIRYNGASILPTNAGTYTVTADFAPTDGVNYSSLSNATAGSFVIQSAAPTLSVANSPVTYNGTPLSAAVNGSVPGTVSDVKYNGSSIVPTNAGTYAVTANFAPTDSVNFSNVTVAAAGNFTVQKATPTLSVSNSPATYNGSAQAAVVAGSVPGAATNVTYNGSSTVPVNAGSYAIFADFAPTDVSNYSSLTAASAGTYAIQQAPLTITATGPSKTYGVALTSGPSATNFSAAGTMGTETVASVTLTPDAAGLSTTASAATTYVVTPSLATGAGGFLASNYQISYVPYSGTISQAAATITLSGLDQNFTGTPRLVTATTNPVGLSVGITYDGSSTAPTAAGSYAVVATITDPNYQGSATGTLAITLQTIADWRASHFTASEISDGMAADGMDPEGDGFTNLQEYTLGTDPRSFTAPLLTITQTGANQTSLTFTARAATGQGYAGRTRKYDLQFTTDLATPDSWENVAGQVDVVGADQPVSVPMPNDVVKKFFRLNVSIE